MPIEKMRIYLITQPYLDIEKEKGGVAQVIVQRMPEGKWLPVFSVSNGADGHVWCALTAMDTGEVRAWDNLSKLFEWIRESFGVYRVETSLTDVEIEFQGET